MPTPRRHHAAVYGQLAFAGDGLVKSHYSTDLLENINQVFDRMKAGAIDGRVAMTL